METLFWLLTHLIFEGIMTNHIPFFVRNTQRKDLHRPDFLTEMALCDPQVRKLLPVRIEADVDADITDFVKTAHLTPGFPPACG